MRSFALILFGFFLLVIQGSLGVLFSLHAVAPNLLLPIVMFLAVTSDVHIVRGAALSFVLGYLLDAFCGSSIGLHTFVMVAIFMVARGAGPRLFMLRGPLSEAGLTLVAALVAGGTVPALRAIFDQSMRGGGLAESFGVMSTLIIQSALLTAALAPMVFGLVRRIDGLFVARVEEAKVS